MAYTGTLARNIEVEDTGAAALEVAQRRDEFGERDARLTYPKNLEGSNHHPGREGQRPRRRCWR